MGLLNNILLAIVAILLGSIIIPIGILFAIVWLIFHKGESLGIKYFSRIFRNIALSIDILGNFCCAIMFNVVLIKSNSTLYRFGKNGDTISKVIGLNLQQGNLTMIGKGVNKILNVFEKDHSIKAVTNNYKYED
jgi:hypothetical protein